MLAAGGAAHELATPLSTISVIAGELDRLESDVIATAKHLAKRKLHRAPPRAPCAQQRAVDVEQGNRDVHAEQCSSHWFS